MEQEGVGERNRRIVQQGGDRQPPPPPPPRPCPRCDSPNTKFCYYNNYRLAQPRYFCKTCKRYWTQGGILRNVPVGGGSRKGKRAKNASSSGSQQPPPQPPQPEEVVVQTQQPNFTTVITAQEPSPFYEGGGGGYLSSLAAIHSQPNPFDDNSLNNAVGSSNLGFVSGLNAAASLGQIQPPPYQFSQGFINNSTTTTTSEASALWSTTISTTSSISGSSSTQRNNASASGSSSPFIPPNQWPDLPGYGPDP